MTVAWPAVRAQLASALPALLPGVTVYDGPVVTGDSPQAYLTIAHQPSTDDERAGSYEQTQSPVGGFVAEETGTVLLEAGALTGDSTVPSAFAIAAALEDWVQEDQTLGVLSPSSTASLSVDVLQRNAAGAVQRLLITLSYFTRLERST